ncbi:TauD/TfdA family dioxygenase [Sphingomonadaceae bacterium G21617-S1]|nr:TauD/TfdA family dioxygenase [Sphingomonadaceae bacterium G21617-S1]
MSRMIARSRYFDVQPLAADLDWGVVVCGLDSGKIADPGVQKDLYDLWIQEGVIIFRELTGTDDHLALSRIFGTLREHPAPENRVPGATELTNVRHNPENGWVNRVNGELRGNWLPWHSDLIYVEKINHGGILRPLKLPSHLGQTGFIDKISAYESLAEDLKIKIENLFVTYKYDLNITHMQFGVTHDVEHIQFSSNAQAVQDSTDGYPIVLHPMVFTQPETGRKVLNISPWFATGIYKMDNDEGDELLAKVAKHIVECDSYFHDWRIDDMVLWDNWRMLHASTGAPVDEERFMQRTTIGGDYGLGLIDPNFTGSVAGRHYIQV